MFVIQCQCEVGSIWYFSEVTLKSRESIDWRIVSTRDLQEALQFTTFEEAASRIPKNYLEKHKNRVLKIVKIEVRTIGETLITQDKKQMYAARIFVSGNFYYLIKVDTSDPHPRAGYSVYPATGDIRHIPDLAISANREDFKYIAEYTAQTIEQGLRALYGSVRTYGFSEDVVNALRNDLQVVEISE